MAGRFLAFAPISALPPAQTVEYDENLLRSCKLILCGHGARGGGA